MRNHNGSSLPMSYGKDMRLARRVLRKDREAFGEFFSTYFTLIYRFCLSRLRHTSGETEVEDIVQNVMIKGLRNLDGYRGEASLSTWLCQIARHEIASWERSQGWRVAATTSTDYRDTAGANARADGEATDDLEGRAALAQLVRIALDRLPGDYGFALAQKYVAGRSVKEIASLLGRTATATQSLLARARTAFVDAYRDVQRETGECDER